MVILADDVRHLGFCIGRLLYTLQSRIHPAIHIGAALIAHTFTMYRSGLVAVVIISNQLRENIIAVFHRLEAVGILQLWIPCLVGDGPHNDRGLILQCMERGRCPVFQCYLGEILRHRIDLINQRVRFNVGFCHHVQAVFVAEIIEVFIVSIVRSTNRIDVILFHQTDVLFCHIAWNILSIEWIRLATVDTFDEERLPVDRHRLIFLCDIVIRIIEFRMCKANLSEAQLLRNALYIRHCILIIQIQNQRIEIGVFCGPQMWIFYSPCLFIAGLFARCNFTHIKALGLKLLLGNQLLLCIVKLYLYGIVVHRNGTKILDIDIHLQGRILILIVQIGFQLVVVDMNQRGCEQVDIAENTAIADHILFFHPGCVCELVNLNCQDIRFSCWV